MRWLFIIPGSLFLLGILVYALPASNVTLYQAGRFPLTLPMVLFGGLLYLGHRVTK